MEKVNPLVGKVVSSVDLASDKRAIRFNLVDGEPVVARADGDCCSQSWIEEVQGVDQLVGSVVVSVEDVSMPDQPYDTGEHESLAFYGCKITTEKGFALIDYRNSSNGYYGGNLAWPDDGYFYGGVYGQNVSSEEWQPVQG